MKSVGKQSFKRIVVWCTPALISSDRTFSHSIRPAQILLKVFHFLTTSSIFVTPSTAILLLLACKLPINSYSRCCFLPMSVRPIKPPQWLVGREWLVISNSSQVPCMLPTHILLRTQQARLEMRVPFLYGDVIFLHLKIRPNLGKKLII